MIQLDQDELKILAYAVTYARSSTKLRVGEQDALSRVMMKVSAEIIRDGPHYIVGNGSKRKISDKQARHLRADRLKRVIQARANGKLRKAPIDS